MSLSLLAQIRFSTSADEDPALPLEGGDGELQKSVAASLCLKFLGSPTDVCADACGTFSCVNCS